MKSIILWILLSIVCIPVWIKQAYDILVAWNQSYQPHFSAALMFYLMTCFAFLAKVFGSIKSYSDDKKHSVLMKKWEEDRVSIDKKFKQDMEENNKKWEEQKKLFEKADEISKAFEAAISKEMNTDIRELKDTVNKQANVFAEFISSFLKKDKSQEVVKYNKLIEEFPYLAVNLKRYFINAIAKTRLDTEYTNCTAIGSAAFMGSPPDKGG